MTRWQDLILWFALVLAACTGCGKQCFLSEGGSAGIQGIELPPHAETDPALSCVASANATPAPTTIVDTTRPIRYLSLREAIALALENGTVGLQTALQSGGTLEDLVSFSGTTLSAPDAIRVLALNPAIAATDIEASLAKFDTRWNTSLAWTRMDQPVGSALENLQTGSAPLDFIHTDNVNFSTGLLKPLPTGGVAGITFATSYELTNVAANVNPAYRPSVQFQFEQPLLQGFGTEINQLRVMHPGSILTPFPNASRVEGILITRLRLDEQRASIERSINYLLLNVEAAYWNLYGAYYQLYSQEEAMRLGFEVWRLSKIRFERGRIQMEDLSQARVQYEEFRTQRLVALGQVLESERQLRGLIGLPIEDGSRLVPSDSPVLEPFQPDWSSALDEALNSRPELALARQDLKFRQLDLIRQKNLLLPDLRFTSTYNLHALGDHIDGGPQPGNAFHELVSDPFGTLTLGLQMSVPIGNRDVHAGLRAARLNLASSYAVLRNEELRAERFLATSYRQLYQFRAQILGQQATLEAATLQINTRFKRFTLGSGALDIAFLIAERDWVNALSGKYNAIVQYNTALARFQFAKGSIMQYDSVFIGEGPLPHGVQMRAVEHERQRTRAIVLRERTQAVNYPTFCFDKQKANPGLPHLPANRAPSLPALFDRRPPLPGELPPGKPVSQAIGAESPSTALGAAASTGPELSVDIPSQEPQPEEQAESAPAGAPDE